MVEIKRQANGTAPAGPSKSGVVRPSEQDPYSTIYSKPILKSKGPSPVLSCLRLQNMSGESCLPAFGTKVSKLNWQGVPQHQEMVDL